MANLFKKKLRQMVYKENLDSHTYNTPLISKKNVSWAEEPDADISNKHVQNARRSTPFPNRAKKFKTTCNVQQTLTFSESDSDDESIFVNDSFMSDVDISDIEIGQKRKRSDLQSKWAVSDQKLIPDKYTTSSWKEKDLIQSPELPSDASISLDSFSDQIIQNTDSEDDHSQLNGDTDGENADDCKLNGDTDSEDADDCKLNGDTDSEDDSKLNSGTDSDDDPKLNGNADSEDVDDSKLNGDTDSEDVDDSKLNGDTDSDDSKENGDTDSDDSNIIFDPNLSLTKKIFDNMKANNLPTEDNSFESSDAYSDSVEDVSDSDLEQKQQKLESSSEEECISKGTGNNRKLSILSDSSSEEENVHLEQLIVAGNQKLQLIDSSSDESSEDSCDNFNFNEVFNPNLVQMDECVIFEPGKNKNISTDGGKNTSNIVTDDSSFTLNYSDNKPPNKLTNKRKRIKKSEINETQHSDSSNHSTEIPNTNTQVTKNDSSLDETENTTSKTTDNSKSYSSDNSINDEENTESLTRISECELEPISNIDAAATPIVESELNHLETSIDQDDSQIEETCDIQQFLRYHIAANYCILLLKDPLKLYFHGKLSMSVLSGACDVLGHELTFEMKKEIDIYSPRGNCFLCFETLIYKKNSNINSTLKEYNMTDEQIKNFCTDLPESYTIIAVKNIKNNMLTYLEKHVAQLLFPKVQNAYDSKRPLADLENKLQCLFGIETKYWKVYNTHEDWLPLVDQMIRSTKESRSRTLLCGGKGVGKSVLMRYMINKMLHEVDKVVCIDLDPGQHEFTLPGCVSVTIVDAPIFGPNYSHLKKPDKCFFIGDVNIAHCLDRYISSVKAIMKYCEENISKDLPWVINYMGFTRSLGTDLIISIIKLVVPSLVIQIESEFANRNYTSFLSQKTILKYKATVPIHTPYKKLNYNLIVLSSVADHKVAGEWEYEPRQIREMSILAYFSQMLENSTEITNCTPYAVKLSSVTLYRSDFTKANTPAVFNANIVALCTINDQEIIGRTESVSCCGFGIVRGIDPDNNELYLLTPVEENDLKSVNCLFMGNIAVPPSVYMSSGHDGHVPYIAIGVQKGISHIPKRAFRYKSLLKK